MNIPFVCIHSHFVLLSFATHKQMAVKGSNINKGFMHTCVHTYCTYILYMHNAYVRTYSTYQLLLPQKLLFKIVFLNVVSVTKISHGGYNATFVPSSIQSPTPSPLVLACAASELNPGIVRLRNSARSQFSYFLPHTLYGTNAKSFQNRRHESI